MRVYILEKKVKGLDNSFVCTTKFKTVLNETKRMLLDGQRFFIYELRIHKDKSISFSRLRETLESGELEFERISNGSVENFNNPEFYLEINETTKRVYKKEEKENKGNESLVFKVKLKDRLMIFPEKGVEWIGNALYS